MAFPPDRILITVAGLLNLVLGLLLLTLNINSRANRPFAILMLLRAGTHTHFALGAMFAEQAGAWQRAATHFGTWMIAALAYFLSIYPAPRRWLPRGAAGPAPFIVAALAASVFYLLRPDLNDGYDSPVFLIVGLAASAMFAVAALVLSLDFLAMPAGRARASTRLLAMGFAGVGAIDFAGAWMAGRMAPHVSPGAATTVIGIVWGALLLSLAVVLVRHRGRPGALSLLVVTSVAGAVGVVTNLAPFGATNVAGSYVGAGLARLLLPILLAYALVRLQVFDLDARVLRGLGRVLVLAAFVLLFFAVSEAAELVVSSLWGNVVGLGASLLLLVALRPLESASQTFVRRLFPRAQDPSRLDHDGRADVYADMVEAAWLDGAPTPGERRVLEAARARLRVTPAAAVRIETQVAQARAAQAGSRNLISGHPT